MSTEFSERPPGKNRKRFYSKALRLIYVPFQNSRACEGKPSAVPGFVDLIRQPGERPLNVPQGPGMVVRIVLVDPVCA